MQFVLPIIALLFIVVASFIVIRFGAMALTMTGLSHDASMFQAISAFFGVGFTTREAEMVVNHPVRRRIIAHLIIAGNIGIFAGGGSLIVTFIQAGTETVAPWIALGVLVGGGVVITLLFRAGLIRRAVDATIRFTLEHTGVVRALDYELLLRVESGYCVSEVEIDPGHRLVGQTLAASGLGEGGVVVLGIARADGSYVGAPTAVTRIERADVLTVYGREEAVRGIVGSGGAGDRDDNRG